MFSNNPGVSSGCDDVEVVAQCGECGFHERQNTVYTNFDETSIPLVYSGSVGKVVAMDGGNRLPCLSRERHGPRSHPGLGCLSGPTRPNNPGKGHLASTGRPGWFIVATGGANMKMSGHELKTRSETFRADCAAVALQPSLARPSQAQRNPARPYST